MSPSLPFSLATAVFVSFLALIASAQAGGSLTRDEFLAEIADPSLRHHIAEHFELSEEGRAFRGGRHLPNAGERVAPFEILVRPSPGDRSRVVFRLDSPDSRQVVVLTCSESAHYDRDCL